MSYSPRRRPDESLSSSINCWTFALGGGNAKTLPSASRHLPSLVRRRHLPSSPRRRCCENATERCGTSADPQRSSSARLLGVPGRGPPPHSRRVLKRNGTSLDGYIPATRRAASDSSMPQLLFCHTSFAETGGHRGHIRVGFLLSVRHSCPRRWDTSPGSKECNGRGCSRQRKGSSLCFGIPALTMTQRRGRG